MAPEGERGDHAEVAAATSLSAQNRSLCDSALAVTKRPSASTTSARYQIVDRQAEAAGEVAHSPPSVSPATPVVDTKPEGSAIPNAPVA